MALRARLGQWPQALALAEAHDAAALPSLLCQHGQVQSCCMSCMHGSASESWDRIHASPSGVPTSCAEMLACPQQKPEVPFVVLITEHMCSKLSQQCRPRPFCMQHFHRQLRSVHSPPLSCQAREQAGGHAGARDAFERALALGTDPKPTADPAHACPPPAATAPLGTDTARGPVRPASGFEHYESLGFLNQEETAGAVGGLARAALRLGDLALGLRAAAAAADAALSLECAGILERQGRLEVIFCTLED